MKVFVQAEINPTEDPEKVRRAVENLFSNLTIRIQPRNAGGLLIGEGEGLDALTKLYNLLRRERICDAARGVLRSGVVGKTITFHLNKQVAYAGHISFSKPVGESPLGPITVRIECENPQKLIDWLTPKTA